MITHVLERSQRITRPRHEVFDFFSRAENLERLTPKQLRFRILSPLPIEMRQGTLIDYQIRLFGVPMKWKTRIEVWLPEERFVDMQLRGPYRRWHHEHRFVAIGNETEMFDRVEYSMPFGMVGEAARIVAVRKMLEYIFDFRRATIAEQF